MDRGELSKLPELLRTAREIGCRKLKLPAPRVRHPDRGSGNGKPSLKRKISAQCVKYKKR